MDIKETFGPLYRQQKGLEVLKRSMTLNELLLNINFVSFKDVVHQRDVLTAADKAAYLDAGYNIPFTVDEFRAVLPDIDPQHIHYTKSISGPCFYFNEDTFAANPLHLEMLVAGMDLFTPEAFLSAISRRESDVAHGDYMGSAMSMPGSMQLEYVQMLAEKKGADNVPGIYALFMEMYSHSDYGASVVKRSVLESITRRKTDEERRTTEEKLAALPERVTVYRGGGDKSVPYQKAYSWTLDENVANFFAIRRGYEPAYIAKGYIHKSDIIEYLDDRGEEEIFAFPQNIEDVEVVELKGADDFLAHILPKVSGLYHKYVDKLMDVPFSMDSELHGKKHCARVLLHCLLLSEMLGLPASDRRILATAAIYHDSRRTHDGEAPNHGRHAAAHYCDRAENPDPVVEFLCHYHSLPDEVGYEAIRSNRVLSKHRQRVTRLFQIFKDADGLERVRLGDIRHNMDLAQYRLPETRTLTLVARLVLENVKLPDD